MPDHTYTFDDLTGATITLTLRDSLWGKIRHKTLRQIGMPDLDGDEDSALPDADERAYFAYVMAYTVAADGLDIAPDTIDTLARFDAQYAIFMKRVTLELLLGCMQAVNALRVPNDDPATKPDAELSKAERHDPKSSPPAKSTSAA